MKYQAHLQDFIRQIIRNIPVCNDQPTQYIKGFYGATVSAPVFKEIAGKLF
jgi:hypothetical protein